MKKNPRSLILLVILLLITKLSNAQNKILVFQSDFGFKDGAVSAMKGVAMGVSTDLKLYDLTHDIPAYNIWEAAYRLEQTVRYWPAGTVFVSVVDPGVGTNRKSVVLKTKSGHYIVTPDNGTLTLVAASLGIDEVRQIDEAVNRRKGLAEILYLSWPRCIRIYRCARLAAGVISFEQVGQLLPKQVVSIPFQKATLAGKMIKGNIPILDVQYGNIWTNIPDSLFNQLKPRFGDTVHAIIYHKTALIYKGDIAYMQTFGGVAALKPLAYINSLLQLSFALNTGDFAKTYGVESGSEWSVEVNLK